jgi:hypothetical protein
MDWMRAGLLIAVAALVGACGGGTSSPPVLASAFVFSAPAIAQTAQVAYVAVTATDASGHTLAGYHGAVRVSSSDPRAQLPGTVAFTAGAAAFQVTFHTVGSQTVTVTDVSGAPAATSPPIVVSNPPAPAIGMFSPQGATLGVPYTFTFQASGFTPVLLTLTGTPPPGLTFASAGTDSGADGVLSGTPAAAGSYPIAVQAIDGAGQSVNQDFTVQVFQHGFRLSAAMLRPLGYHTATLLVTGQVLVAGGFDGSSASGAPTAAAELSDPVTQTFTATGNMNDARVFHTATALCDTSATSCGNPRVLIAGGERGVAGTDLVYLATAELFDPATGTFTATGSLSAPRERHTSTLLSNGKVLIAGGLSVGQGSTASLPAAAELFDPATATFTATGSLSVPREYHTATLLQNGKVLIAGGVDSNGQFLGQTELYDPATGLFTPTGNMIDARYLHSATLLPSGKVLIVGGEGKSPYVAPPEIYDPATGTFALTGTLVMPDWFPWAAVLLRDGTVLVAGGEVLGTVGAPGCCGARYAELYDPTSGTFSETGGLQSFEDASSQLTALGAKSPALALVTGESVTTFAEVYQ